MSKESNEKAVEQKESTPKDVNININTNQQEISDQKDENIETPSLSEEEIKEYKALKAEKLFSDNINKVKEGMKVANLKGNPKHILNVVPHLKNLESEKLTTELQKIAKDTETSYLFKSKAWGHTSSLNNTPPPGQKPKPKGVQEQFYTKPDGTPTMIRKKKVDHFE